MSGQAMVMIALIVVGLPVVMLVVLTSRWLKYREKRLEIEAAMAAEKAAQYATSNAQLEQRVRVLEQIVTDAGAQTAAQIEALRDHSKLPATAARPGEPD